MRENPRGEMVVAAIGSMTGAIKAKRALEAKGIACEIVSLEPSATKRGCAYGVIFAPGLEKAIRGVLREARIPVSQYLHRDGSLP